MWVVQELLSNFISLIEYTPVPHSAELGQHPAWGWGCRSHPLQKRPRWGRTGRSCHVGHPHQDPWASVQLTDGWEMRSTLASTVRFHTFPDWKIGINKFSFFLEILMLAHLVRRGVCVCVWTCKQSLMEIKDWQTRRASQSRTKSMTTFPEE